jgi:hypothetical protein
VDASMQPREKEIAFWYERFGFALSRTATVSTVGHRNGFPMRPRGVVRRLLTITVQGRTFAVRPGGGTYRIMTRAAEQRVSCSPSR